MTCYYLRNITNDKLKSELQRFYSSHNIKPKSTTEGLIYFEKGSVWGYSSDNFLVQGNMRFQSLGEFISCSITFSRTKIFLVNSLFGIIFTALIGCFLIIFQDQLLFPAVFLTVGWLFPLLFVVVVVIFLEFYLLEAVEKKFLELFEIWFESYLT